MFLRIGVVMDGYDLGELFLFWLADATGASIDRLYAARPVRIVMIVLAKLGGSFSRLPR